MRSAQMMLHMPIDIFAHYRRRHDIVRSKSYTLLFTIVIDADDAESLRLFHRSDC